MVEKFRKKREDRTTAMLILSTRPQEVNFKDFSKEPMLKAQKIGRASCRERVLR